MNQKYIVAGASALVGVLSVAGVALAREGDAMRIPSQGQSSMIAPEHTNQQTYPKPLELTINPKGDVTLRGKVQSVGSSTLTIKTWGGLWTIDIPVGASVTPKDISTFIVGDFVGVVGTASMDSQIVTAKVVRSWGTKSTKGSMMGQKGDRDADRVMMGTSTDRMPRAPMMDRTGSSTNDNRSGQETMGMPGRGDDHRQPRPLMQNGQ